MIVAFTSYGNDSLALMRWLHEAGGPAHFGPIVCVYSDTGWAAPWWAERVERAEGVARSYGFTTRFAR